MTAAAKMHGLRDVASLWQAPLSDAVAEATAVVLLCPVLLAVALWNEFPIIFYDTGGYVLQGLGGAFVEERSPVYSLLLWFAGAAQSLWLVALMQAALTAFVIVQTTRAIAPKLSIVALLAIVGALVTLTALPWYVGQIEPDCFAALSILCLYLLVFHVPTLGLRRSIAIWLVAALAIAVHPSHLVLAAGLVLAIIVYKAFAAWRGPSWPNARIRYAAAALLLGVLTIVASNFGYTQKIFLSRAGPVFVFARILQDGIVMRLLDDTCPQAHYKLCAYKDDLPRTADQWLWGAESPFQKLGRFEGTTKESQRILWASLKRYPLEQLAAATHDSIRQFTMFRTGDQIEPQQWVLFSDLDRLMPNQMRAYLTARQQRTGIGFAPINRVQVPFGWLSIGFLTLALLSALWLGARSQAVLLGFVLVALIGNAIVCGALSNPHDRYQSRLIWLAPFALALLAGGRPLALRQREESGT
ncbi:MAG: hypothetical protein WBQ17_08990 [Rhizomicrobium sp.]